MDIIVVYIHCLEERLKSETEDDKKSNLCGEQYTNISAGVTSGECKYTSYDF